MFDKTLFPGKDDVEWRESAEEREHSPRVWSFRRAQQYKYIPPLSIANEVQTMSTGGLPRVELWLAKLSARSFPSVFLWLRIHRKEALNGQVRLLSSPLHRIIRLGDVTAGSL